MVDHTLTTVPVRIVAQEVSEEMCGTLDDLATTLRSAALATSEQRAPGPSGTKDAGLTIGLTITGLALTGIGTLVSALTYWYQRQRTARVTVTVGNVAVAIDVADSDLDTTIARLHEAVTSATVPLEVHVALEPGDRDFG